MNTYELINPSEPVTFQTTDDKVAFMVTVTISGGRYGCRREDGEKLTGPVAFYADPDAVIQKFMQVDVADWSSKNTTALGKCFQTFQYVDIYERPEYDAQLATYKEPEKAEMFKEIWENNNRKSMNPIVKNAWRFSKAFLEEKSTV
jgi:hypothetical protein